MTPSPQPRQPRADLNGGGLFLSASTSRRGMDTDGRTLLLALVIGLTSSTPSSSPAAATAPPG